MVENLVSFWVNQVKERGRPDGGFSPRPGSRSRTDATCWAILALGGEPGNRDLLSRARSRLAADQSADGRVCIDADHPEVFWPTFLAVLAWHQSPEHREHQTRAADFLIACRGEHWPRTPHDPTAHDTDIQGWPWIAGTHAWAEPTALALMALKIAGYGGHKRVQEGARLLLNRQLPRGGWNYGNTLVYGQELRPMPLSTGLVLNALRGQASLATIQVSRTYLQSRVASLSTPGSLGWSLLGLGAWGARPAPSRNFIAACLKNQARYGPYDTTSLCLLLVALKSPGGLEEIFLDPGKS